MKDEKIICEFDKNGKNIQDLIMNVFEIYLENNFNIKNEI